MAKILRSSNRLNTPKDISLSDEFNLKGIDKVGKEGRAMTMKENRKRRHVLEGHQTNPNENENEGHKENESFSDKVPIDDIDEPSEYELLRLRNIEQRRLMFQQLDIDQSKREATLAAGVLIDNEGKYIPSKRGLAARPKVKEFLPPRKSLRLQNISADTGLKLPDKEPTKYFTYDPSEVDNSRQPMRDLELEEFISQKDKSGDSEIVSNYLTKINENLKVKDKNSDTNSFKDDQKQLKKLKIKADQVAKVTPNRIFSLTVHPTERKLLIAAGEKWGGVGLWDANDHTSSTHGVHLFTPHSRPVNCLTFNETNDTNLISTSYDGTVRSFDLEKQMSVLLYGLEDNDDGYLTYHCQKDHSTILVSGADGNGKYSKGYVGVIDMRSSHNKLAHRFNVTTGSSARTVSIHPTKSDLFVCAARHGTCMLFDMRGKNATKDLIKPLTKFYGHTKAISSAFFSPLTGEKLATVCYDNKIRVYDLSHHEDEKHPAVAFYHNNNTGRWLSTFKAIWYPKREDILLVGSMNHPRQIDVLSDKGIPYQSLQGEHLGSICSLITCHPTQDIVIGGNSSGRVHFFR